MTPDDRQVQVLFEAAKAVQANAYAPYSHFHVGAAIRTTSGAVYASCNVENAAYGVTLCAECGLVSDLVASGGGRLVAFACVNALGEPLMPCGRCRQLLYEFGGTELLIDTPEGVWPMSRVLPQAFGPSDITHVTGG